MYRGVASNSNRRFGAAPFCVASHSSYSVRNSLVGNVVRI
jgi:hypothetical protein